MIDPHDDVITTRRQRDVIACLCELVADKRGADPRDIAIIVRASRRGFVFMTDDEWERVEAAMQRIDDRLG